jgi:hypothetical protein
MIVSKPQTNTIVSFTFFLILTFSVLGMNIWTIVHLLQPAWYNYAVVGALTPIGLFVVYKIFIRYRVLRFGNNQIEIIFPVLRSVKKYPVDQIEYWAEKQVKTGKKSVYKELELAFKDRKKENIGHKEFTEYNRIVQYLKQKASKKQRV